METTTTRTDVKQRFGLRLRQLRKESRLTQAQLAAKAHLDKSYLASIEQGKRNVSLENIEKLVNTLGITFPEFFHWESVSHHQAMGVA